LSLAGGSSLIFIVAPLIYWSLNKRTGQHMVVLLLLGALVSTIAKQVLATPRPIVAHPDQVNALVEAHGGGIPSGHVTNTVLFWSPLVMLLNDRRWWWLFGGFVLLMAWSRMYAGVHYPQDVLGGMLLGGLLLWLYCRTSFDVETLTAPRWMAGLLLLSAAIIPLAWTYKDGLTTIGAFWGVMWGLWVETRYLHVMMEGDWGQRVLRYAAGMALLLALFLGLRFLFESVHPAALFRMLRYGLLTFFAVAVWPWAWPKIGLSEQA
jgi:hypothetical protein